MITRTKQLIFLLLISISLSAQEKAVDSLKQALRTAKHDSLSVKIYNELGELFYDNFPDSAMVFLNKAIALCENRTVTTNKILENFYLRQLTRALGNISFIYFQHGDIDLTLKLLKKGLRISRELNDKPGIAYSLNALGYIYDGLGDVNGALEYYHGSLKIREELNDKRGVGIALNNIGYIYDSQNDLTKALEYYKQDLKLREEIKDMAGIANSLNNIGTIYERDNQLEKALEYHQRSLKISETLDDKHGIGTSLHNMGMVYEKQGKNKEGLEYYTKSLVLREMMKDKEGIAYSSASVAKIMLKTGKEPNALAYALQSLKYAKELGFPETINNAAELLTKIYTKQRKFREAYGMYELEILMRDSINNNETRKASIKKQFQYAYEKQAAQDSIERAEEQKVKTAQLFAQEAQLKQERTQRFALYGGMVLAACFTGFVFNRFRITQKQKHIIEWQKKEVDKAYEKLNERNKEVMDSINYARKIQTSLLPTEKYISKKLEGRRT